MKAKVNLENAGAELLSSRRTRRKEMLLVLKKGGDAFENALYQMAREEPEVKSLVSKWSLEVTSTRPSQEKRLLSTYASRWASQTSETSAGCTSALAVCRLWWSV